MEKWNNNNRKGRRQSISLLVHLFFNLSIPPSILLVQCRVIGIYPRSYGSKDLGKGKITRQMSQEFTIENKGICGLMAPSHSHQEPSRARPISWTDGSSLERMRVDPELYPQAMDS